MERQVWGRASTGSTRCQAGGWVEQGVSEGLDAAGDGKDFGTAGKPKGGTILTLLPREGGWEVGVMRLLFPAFSLLHPQVKGPGIHIRTCPHPSQGLHLSAVLRVGSGTL